MVINEQDARPGLRRSGVRRDSGRLGWLLGRGREIYDEASAQAQPRLVPSKRPW